MRAVNPAPLVAGNTVRLLIDGSATYRAMFAAMRDARDHINLETYIYDEEGFGERLGKLLVEKQKQGVQINLMYGSVGSLSTRREQFFHPERTQRRTATLARYPDRGARSGGKEIPGAG